MNPRPSSSLETGENKGLPAAPASRCVLLAEDDRSVRRYLEVTLQRCGYKVITAADGLEAMKLALTSEIDAVVTDAVMPHMSGQELARFLRSNPKVARLPIILLTGQENNEVINLPPNLIDAFLYKPVKVDELKSCLDTLLQNPSVGRDAAP